MVDPQHPGAPQVDPYEHIGRYPQAPQKPAARSGGSLALLWGMIGGFLLLMVIATAVIVAVVQNRKEEPADARAAVDADSRKSAAVPRGAASQAASDREYLVTIDDVQRHVVGLEKVEASEKFEKDSFLGSKELSYEYDPPGDDAIYVSSSVTVDRSASSARDTYAGLKLGLNIGLSMGEAEVEQTERNDLLKWGDESKSVLLSSEGKPFGNAFIARKGKRTFFVTIAGVYFDDPEAFRELVEPKLERAELYDP